MRVENAAEVPGWAWPVIVVVGFVFLAAGGALIFGRNWMVIDNLTRTVSKQWGLLVPMKRTEFPLDAYTQVTLKFYPGDSDSCDRWSVELQSGGYDAGLQVWSAASYPEVRESARFLAGFLKLSFIDASSEHPVIVKPGELHRSLSDELSERPGADESVTQPYPMRSTVEELDHRARIVIPGLGRRRMWWLELLFPLGVLWYVLPGLMHFFNRSHTPPLVQWVFGGFLVLFFVLAPLLGVLNSLLNTRRARTIVLVTPQGISIEQHSSWRARTTTIRAADILGLDYSTARGAVEAVTAAVETTRAQSNPEGPAPLLSGSLGRGFVKLTAALARSRGIIVKSAKGVFTFAAGLPDDEVRYLHSIVRRSLRPG